jgi:phosphoserine aminotransferase
LLKHAWTEASVEFFSDEEQGICLVSVPQLKFLPRIGETVMLPNRDDDSSKTLYEVVDVNYNFYREMAGTLPQEARLMSINVTVKRK